ncbi:hypothetical protein E6W36_08720 [Hankyongella ginsenosidimutans]|uniref:Uncharacterized protein n=1 Tax=Hankyongella ginsenosidimutans TaxID=1763828 RepID=A0A4D7C1J7_9SPHN|nr:hypothetical protein [Hankyongella ginsenosidimutans]QCI79594.1 hypothetical protein E6W36_08720 [Hankyongella ginsenosidimutans]
MAAIGRATVTKLRNGTINNITGKTAIKSAIGLNIYDLPGSVAGQTISDGVDTGAAALKSRQPGKGKIVTAPSA